MRTPTAARIWLSTSLLCAGFLLFPTVNRWMETRTWVAVDMPISLAPGHIRTGSFPINLSADYQIEIELNDYGYGQGPECEAYKVVQTRWWLYRDGHVDSNWVDDWYNRWDAEPNGPLTGSYLGVFDSSPGRYTLDVEILPGATCLQAFQPRLRVFSDDSDYVRGGWIRAAALLASFALVGISFASAARLVRIGFSASDTRRRPSDFQYVARGAPVGPAEVATDGAGVEHPQHWIPLRTDLLPSLPDDGSAHSRQICAKQWDPCAPAAARHHSCELQRAGDGVTCLCGPKRQAVLELQADRSGETAARARSRVCAPRRLVGVRRRRSRRSVPSGGASDGFNTRDPR